MKKANSLNLSDRPAEDLVASIMAFLAPPLTTIFTDRLQTGRSPEILAETLCNRIKQLASHVVENHHAARDSTNDPC